jgi:hypothetical protein
MLRCREPSASAMQEAATCVVGSCRPSLAQEPVDRAAGHAEFPGDCRGPEAGIRQRLHPLAVKARLAACVGTSVLGHGDAFELALAAHVGLKRCEDCEHAEERAARGARGIDVLLENLEVRSRLVNLVGDIGEVRKGSP